MGYTHYYYQKKSFTDAQWQAIIEQASGICAKAIAKGIPLGNLEGEESPQINNEEIGLNGHREGSCESFVLTKARRAKKEHEHQAVFDLSGAFEFCKTRQRPYDAVVVSILAEAKRIAPDAIDISSDGGQGVFVNQFK